MTLLHEFKGDLSGDSGDIATAMKDWNKDKRCLIDPEWCLQCSSLLCYRMCVDVSCSVMLEVIVLRFFTNHSILQADSLLNPLL